MTDATGGGASVDAGRFPMWAGPPPGMRPVVTPLSLEVGRSDSTVVLIESARSYPTGLVLRLVVMVRVPDRTGYVYDQLDGWGEQWTTPERGGLGWAVTFSDGQHADAQSSSPWQEMPEAAAADPCSWTPDEAFLEGLNPPVMYFDRWTREFWLWPLPLSGPIHFMCTWGDRGITATTTTLDTAALRAAASLSTPLWPSP